MSFDLIIANPPFGKSSSLSKKIVNVLLENKVAKEMIVLAPPKTFYGILDYSKELKCVSSYLNKTYVFEDAAVETLFLDHIVAEKQNKYKEPSDFLLDEKHKVFRSAVIEYNKSHKNSITFLQMLISKKKEAFSKYEENQIFEIPIHTPANGIQLGGQTGEHNLQEKPIRWPEGSSAPWGLYFETREAFENFRDWYYKVPYSFSRKKRNNISCLWDLILSTLLNLWGSGPSILKYDFVLPHLDWSHPWTDQEVLREIGLPEGFLEKE